MTEQQVVNGQGEARDSAVSGHLRWIHDLLDRLRLPPERRDALRSRLRAVDARAADPELKVAVFGEASSGKSTLLNALLRRRLLPSSARVTTHTTTVLRYRDGAVGMVVRTTDDTVRAWPSREFSQWTGRHHTAVPGDLEIALERVLTTDLATQVADLEVLSPVPLLGGGTAVLDTPGFSVTDPGHRQLAEAAVRQADLALVVVPAVSAMSMTLVEFLDGPLHDHYDRCAFVLTKTDLLDDDERSEVVETVENRLRELGIADPVLLPCAPARALKELTAGPDAPGAGPPPSRAPGSGPDAHLPRFLAVEARIAELAADRRQSAMKATVLALLAELLLAVEEAAESQRSALLHTEQGLAALSLPDFPAFLGAWSQHVLERVKGQLGRAAVAGVPAGSRAELDAAVTEAVAGERIGNIAEATENVSRIVRLHLRADAERTVHAAVDEAGELLRSEARKLANDFTAEYRALAGLAGESWTAPAAPRVTVRGLLAPDLSGVDRRLTEIGTQLTAGGKLRTGGGAMAGAVAGSLIAPGIGTFIGGALGALIGKGSHEAARTRFLERIQPIVSAAYEEIDLRVGESLLRVPVGVTESIAELCERYDSQWGAEIARLTAAHTRQRAELAAGITTMEQAAAAARRRREDVAALRGDGTAPEPEEM